MSISITTSNKIFDDKQNFIIVFRAFSSKISFIKNNNCVFIYDNISSFSLNKIFLENNLIVNKFNIMVVESLDLLHSCKSTDINKEIKVSVKEKNIGPNSSF